MKRDKALSEEFISLYNKLDRFMKEKLSRNDGFSHTRMITYMARQHGMFRRHESELKSLARLRNAIIHNMYPDRAETIAEPHEYVVKRYQEIINSLLEPPKALSIAVLKKDIYVTTLEDNATRVMKAMNENRYTHVPVMDNGKMFGIFSENTVFTYIAEKSTCIRENPRIKDFADFIPLEKHKSEHFIFKDRDSLICDIEELFHRELEGHRRLAVVYITENGRSDEELLGMITSWDIAGV